MPDGTGEFRSAGPRVGVSFHDSTWAAADYVVRSEHLARLVAGYIELVGGAVKRRDLAIAIWAPTGGAVDRGLKVALEQGWIVRVGKGLYALGESR